MKYTSLRLILVILICLGIFIVIRKNTESFDIPYKVQEIDNVLTHEECDMLIEYAKQKGMTKSSVLDNGYEKDAVINIEHRNSKTAWIHDNENPIAMKLAKISEKLTGLPRNTQEELQVAYYEQGGKFNDHYDACSENNKEYCDKINKHAGQRRSTLMIYLNDNFTGGETVFPKIHLTIKPKKGKGVLFWNTTPDEVIIPESLHRGNPVIDGEKWICTKWNHVKPYQ